MKKIVIGIFALFLLLSFTGCDFFVTSWGSGMQRDLEKALKKESTGDLAKLAKDPNYASDPKAAGSLLNALSDKTEADVQALSVSEQESIMDLALAVSIPTSVLTELADIAQAPDNADPEELFKTILGGINSFDTTVLQTILSDEEAQLSASAESLISASVALVAQVMKREGSDLEFEDLQGLIDGGDISESNITEESKADLQAVQAIYKLFESGKRSGDFLGMSLENLFGGK